MEEMPSSKTLFLNLITEIPRMKTYEVTVVVPVARTVIILGDHTVRDNEHQGYFYTQIEIKAMIEACSLVGGQLDDAQVTDIKILEE